MPTDQPKLYCYVDETGQDTLGQLFIVAVVLSGDEQAELVRICEEIEEATGKGKVKWSKARYPKRLAYIQQILLTSALKGKLHYASYQGTKEYLALTIQTVVAAIEAQPQSPEKVTIFVDGLPRSQERHVGSELRRLNVSVRKVRGVRKDENDALIRLADAVCGFVRAALEERGVMADLFKRARESGFLLEVGE